ncbi:aminoacyl-tRNA hydrolase [Youxingia wuxianensis]|uniref:Peptidyl-tRNA hydrolase n=1 Tax=Youxingia wuxianensis TaxID=2763678 RepID=A0A926ESX5_9FIRM|nr:aminoacyl-tRNA hydrolase [Youxingia wuxianensis]MBC8585774.1 aminoacyl-tRNA hydrolase [Youxingia wuxianensis]
MFSKLKNRFSGAAASGPVEFLVVGLGNPGKEYESTRHNIGFHALDFLAENCGTDLKKLKFKSLCGDAMIEGKRVLLMKPSTFMNNSGQAVQEAMSFYKIPIERVLVIFDDVSLDVGRLRIRRQGSDGGHNGIKSIIYLTGKDTFPRIKIGVGQKPDPRYDLAAWVLGKFSKEDAAVLNKELENVACAARLIIQGKIDMAMNKYNC